jgi:hypothetical protein
MDEHPQPGQAFMSALVTEHFVLQSARSTTTSKAVGRSAVYLTCVSSSLVAFGFFAAATHRLAPLLATVLPALLILGIFTFVRLVETNVEDVVCLRRIDTIRRYYATLDPAAATFWGPASRTPGWPNLAGDTLEEIIAAAERGIQRIRATPHLPFSFLRHCGLSRW